MLRGAIAIVLGAVLAMVVHLAHWHWRTTLNAIAVYVVVAAVVIRKPWRQAHRP
jgi:hypothetical protein